MGLLQPIQDTIGQIYHATDHVNAHDLKHTLYLQDTAHNHWAIIKVHSNPICKCEIYLKIETVNFDTIVNITYTYTWI